MKSSKFIEITAHVISEGSKLLSNKDKKKLKKFLVGEYSDGKTRNLTDAIRGECLSSKQKKKIKHKKNLKKYKKFKL